MASGLRNVLPKEILDGSIFLPLVSAYMHAIRAFEKSTGLSQTRFMILFLFRNGATYNQNQLAVALGADRTVVHRVLKTMIRDDLIAETREPGRKQVVMKLTAEGEALRLEIIAKRREMDRKLMSGFKKKEIRRLIDSLTLLDETHLED